MKQISVRPRQLVIRGRVEAAGLWFDTDFYGAGESRRRVLENWESGARLFEMESGLLLRFASPRILRPDQAPGAVLVERNGWLLSAPLSKTEWTEFESEVGHLASYQPINSNGAGQNLALVRDGHLSLNQNARVLDPSSWLQVGDWQVQTLEPLGEVTPITLVAPTAEFDARRALDVPASAELSRFLSELRGEKQAQDGNSWAERLMSLWSRTPRTSGTPGESITAAPKRGFSFKKLFLFRFGANGDAPPLSPGQEFSSEFSMVAKTLPWAIGVSAILNHLLNSSVSVTDFPWQGFLMSILIVAAMAWGLLLLSRWVPTPRSVSQRVASRPNPPSFGSSKPFSTDLLVLIVLCYLALSFWQKGQWGAMALVLVAATVLALMAHWKRRRADSGGIRGVSRAIGAFSALIWLQSVAGMFRRGAGKAASGSAAGVTQAAAEPRPNPFNAWLWRTELSRLFGARQARYMIRMMQMFENGDLDAALRHAVPFNLFGSGNASPSISTPRPRTDLDFLGPKGGGGGTGIPLPPTIKERLTQYYREAHTKLAAKNRVDEAAFVLAELLDSPAEAVQYLEKHERWEKAAQLGEARELEPGLTVRLWWLAGNRNRAVVVARRSNAFADAIARLERQGESERQGAQSLRMLWAQNMALTGDFAGAVETIWPIVKEVPEIRGFVGAWMERGLEGQGMGAARMLGRQAHLLDELNPDTLNGWKEKVRQLLAEPNEEAVPLKLGFGNLLASAPPHELARAAARQTVRTLIHDANLFPQWSSELGSRTKQLLEYANDGALRVDAGNLKFPASSADFATRGGMLTLTFGADDVGALPISDAALLSDGKILIALGESGARLLNRDGKTVAVFDQPCHRLVLSKDGEQAIGVAQRGLGIKTHLASAEGAKQGFIDAMGLREYSRRSEVTRLCRFDLPRKRAEFWGEAEIGEFSSYFADGQWVVTSGDNVVSLDTTAKTPLALWKTKDAGYVEALACDDGSLAMLTHFYNQNMRGRSEIWRFELPTLVLRERRFVPGDFLMELAHTVGPTNFIAPDGSLMLPVRGAGLDSSIIIDNSRTNSFRINMPESEGETALQLESKGIWLVSLNRSEEGVQVRLWTRRNGVSSWRAQFQLMGARQARFRLTDSSLVLCDNRGRVIALDLRTGNVVRDFRHF